MVYCVDETVKEPIMLINKHIGFDPTEGQGVDGALFQQELLYLDGLNKKRIQIWINSPGGTVMDGYNIYSAILKTNTPIDTYAVGGVASISAVIFQAGRKRIMSDYSWLMYHNPFGGTNVKLIETMKESIIKMISQRCEMSEEAVSSMMTRTSYINPAEAITLKMCDSIEESRSENTKYLKKITNELEFHKECNNILNSLLNNDNTNQTKKIMLTKVTMRLKLNDAATEDNIVKAIDEIENRAKTNEVENIRLLDEIKNKETENGNEIEKLKAKISKAEADLKKAQGEYDTCKAQLDAMEMDKKTAEENAKKETAKNLIEGFAQMGRIKNEETTKLKWVETALKLGVDEVKDMIEALPLNKVANTITEPVVNTLGEKELPTTALGMAVRNKLKREGKL